MNVLMFGWEYPPSRSGGLGTACHGLSEALAAQGVGVRFVVPTAPDTPNRRPATLLTADEYIHGAAPVEPPSHPANPLRTLDEANSARPPAASAHDELPAHLVTTPDAPADELPQARATQIAQPPSAQPAPVPQSTEPRHLEVAASMPAAPTASMGSPAQHRSPPPGATLAAKTSPGQAPAGYPPMTLGADEPSAATLDASPVDDPGDSEFPATAAPSATAISAPDDSFPMPLPIGRAPHPVLVRLTLLRGGFELLEVPSPLTPYLTLGAYREEIRRLQDAEAAAGAVAAATPGAPQQTRSMQSQAGVPGASAQRSASASSAAQSQPGAVPHAPQSTSSAPASPPTATADAAAAVADTASQPAPSAPAASPAPAAPTSPAPVPAPAAYVAPPAPAPAPFQAAPPAPAYAPPTVRAARAGLGAERQGPPAPPWAPPDDRAVRAPEHAPNLLRVPIGYGPDLFSEVARLAYLGGELGRRGGFDVVHVHDWMTFMAGTEAKLKSGKTLVVHVHSTEYDRTADKPNPDIISIERYGFKLADRIITVSHRTARQLVERYDVDPARITVVHNGVAAPRQSVAPPRIAGGSSPLVLFAGRITAQKGPIDFVEAAARVLARIPDARFVMAGSGDLLPATIARIRALGIERHFQFTGFLEQHDLAVLFRLTDLYVMPSVSEPFGLTAVEALAQNVPVIISTTTGASEVLGDEVPQVPSGDVDRLGATMIDLLIHPLKARDMVIRSRPAVARLTWTHAARQVIDVYQALTAN